MLTLNNIIRLIWESTLRPLVDMVIPHRCTICGEELQSDQHYICPNCKDEGPLTHFSLDIDNLMTMRVKHHCPNIVHASALLLYYKDSRWRKLIHRFKYSGEWHHGYGLGMWLGEDLLKSDIYDGIDGVIAIPLHPLRQMWRGYNQSDYIARGVAKSLGVKHITNAVKRKRYNRSQVKTSRNERWDNVQSLFSVKRPELLENRSIIIVDDLFTTGATMLSCASAIMAAVPSCKIYIATIAASGREFGPKHQP
ncbi:MAG: phosphoribosyltransferase family protein [Rikenellaceae bacterium]